MLPLKDENGKFEKMEIVERNQMKGNTMDQIRTVNIETEFVDLVKQQIAIFKQLRKFSATQQKLIANGEFEKLVNSLAEKGDLVLTIKQLGKKLNKLHLTLEKSQEPADIKLPENIVTDVRELSDLIESVLALENHNLSSLNSVSFENSVDAELISC